MTSTSVKRNIHFARDFDERTLRQFETTIAAINPSDFSITVYFSNGFSVRCASVTEFLNIPMTDADRIEKIWIRCEEDFATARAAGRPVTKAAIWITDETFFSKISYEIDGDYSSCVSLQHQLDVIFSPTLAVLRSLFHVHFGVDLALTLIILPILAAVFLFPKINISSENFFVAQFVCATAYAFVKLIAFPRIQKKWGYGGKIAARRASPLKLVGGFIVVGGFGAVYQEAIVDWWKSKL